jgi:hypothetical protein
VSTVEQGAVIGFEVSERCIEHFPTRHDDDIEAANVFLPPEQLAGAPLGAIPLDGRAQFPRRGDPEPGGRRSVVHDEHRHEPAMHLRAGAVNPLEFRPSANAFGRSQTLPRHGGSVLLALVGDGQALAPLRATPFQHNTAVLGCHAYPEAVCFLTTPGVGLVGASSFSHDVPSAGRDVLKQAGPCQASLASRKR